MKKVVTVTVEHELEIEIPDELVTPEHIKAFSEMMWNAESPDALFEHAAYCVVNNFEFAEGLGEINPK